MGVERIELNLPDYSHIRTFDWKVCKKKSYAQINREFNSKGVIHQSLNERVTAPVPVIAGGLIMATLFGGVAILLYFTQQGNSMLGPIWCSVGAAALAVALIATIILIYHHCHKLTSEDIAELRKQLKESMNKQSTFAKKVAEDAEARATKYRT